MREYGSLGEVVKFVRGKMEEKASENAAAMAEQSDEEEQPDEHESEEGEGPDEEEPSTSQSPKKIKKKATPKKKKITSGGMQLPEHWPWEEAKELFIHPDVQKSADLDVSYWSR